MSVNRRIASDSIKTGIATFGMQAVAFGVSILVAQFYGATSVTDAYFFALAIPALFTAALFGALKAVFIPVYTDHVTKNPDDKKAVLGAAYSLIFLLSLSAAVVLYFIAPYLMPLVAGGLQDSQSRLLAITLARELMPLVIFSSLIGLMSSIYQSNQRFVVPIITPLARSLVLFLFIFFFKQELGIHALTFGTVVGEALNLTLMVIAMKMRGFYVGFRSIFHPVIQKMSRLSLAPITGNLVLEFNPLVDKIMIASTAVGSVTALNIANRWNEIPLMLLSAGGFMSVILSHWSKLKAEENMKEVIRSFEQSLSMLLFLLLPILASFFVFRFQIISYFYLRKEFNLEAAQNVSLLWGILIWGVLPVLLGRVIVRVYHVMQDTTTPFWIGISRTGLNIVLNFIFKALFGLVGIALSSVLTQVFLTGVNFYLLKRKVKEFEPRRLLVSGLRLLVCVIPAGLAMHLVFPFITALLITLGFSSLFHPIIAIGISSLAGLLVYLLNCYLLKAPELKVALPILAFSRPKHK